MQNFTLATNTGIDFNLADVDQPIVLFFYPRDNTPGCTIENQEFAKLHSKFEDLGYMLVGISRDSVKSHCNFASKFSLPFTLLADEDEVICNMFGVMKDKNMYGKQVRGIERSTFIIDKNKTIVKEWRKVTAEGHANEVLTFIQEHLSK